MMITSKVLTGGRRHRLGPEVGLVTWGCGVTLTRAFSRERWRQKTAQNGLRKKTGGKNLKMFTQARFCRILLQKGEGEWY